MANQLDAEARMTIQALAGLGHSNRNIARLLGVHENAVRYHRQRQAAGLTDGRARQQLRVFALKLSYSRYPAFIWSPRQDQLAWHRVHNEALRRFDGIPAVVRIDNLKTGIVHGAGPWGTINRHYRAYARGVGFHIDACLPGEPQAKGKVERVIRGLRGRCPLYARHWDSLAELQQATDRHIERLMRRRLCPATGQTVAASLALERAHLAPLPVLPEPFDIAVSRTVAVDATVGFEQRRYSVPFAWVGRRVEIRGAAARVQILAEGRVIAMHPRHTPKRILIDPAHYDGPSTGNSPEKWWY